MSNARRYRTLEVSLAANESRKIAVRGSYVRVISADDEFSIGIDDDAEGFFAQGLGFELQDGDLFTELRLTETQGAGNVILLGIGVGKMQDSRASFATAMEVRDDVGIGALLRNADDKRAALNTLEGAVNANGSAAGTITIVDPVANVSGLIVRHGFVRPGAGNAAALCVKASVPSGLNDGAVCGANGEASLWVGALFVPAGFGLYAMSDGGAWSVWYEVL